ncbi:hypothetical protein MSG28_010361 [Choristoneura fumiferana]|uniref:Uncharacterized protein n=1 Tax=Choristoneura fumiferana TaxID=7141 RepID=A0ACC0KKY8_CHOFU|nr:hypothetical protein MSG28_010361 [Choristoneura fumiferana]
MYCRPFGLSIGALLVSLLVSFIIVMVDKNQTSNLDVRLIIRPDEPVKKIKTNHPIDLVLYDNELASDIDRLKQSVESVKSGYQLQKQDISLENIPQEPVKKYGYVALGGTFDRLHNGHKILLTQAALRSSKHVTVGVTDVNMIKSKKLWELIEPVEKRIKAVKDFLTDINPDLEYIVLPIQDLYGPTKDDPRFEMIVVSEETRRGADKINEKRQQSGLPLLDTYVIGLAADNRQTNEEEEKVSSTCTLHVKHYISSYCSRAKGAAIVNCDFIAHDLYKPGLPLNHTLAETFGKNIIQENGENKLQQLNDLLWPAVIEEAQRRAQALGREGYRVVVMEAAVMVRAKWYTQCHQLWSVIIPPEEAIKRLQQRNGLTEEEARQRIESQPSNLEQIELANIVFSPYWSYEFTQIQIDRAWQHLEELLDRRK